MLLTPEQNHTLNLWACIGQFEIKFIGPYPMPPWTMTLEGPLCDLNDRKVMQLLGHTPSTTVGYDP
jgi:hypothetical protein